MNSHETAIAAPISPSDALARLWELAALPAVALANARLTGSEPALPSSFAVATAAQATMAAAALAAGEVWRHRGGRRQQVSLDLREAGLECFGYFSLDGRVPEIWDKLSGLYTCGGETGSPGHVRIHANFAHHRDGALRVLGLPPGPATERKDVEAALRSWSAEAFEQAAADAGVVVAALRRFQDWDRHPQGIAIADLPPLVFERIGDAPKRTLPALDQHGRPLSGVRVLELTRILAGPVAGRTLAAHGADVMLVNSPHLPNIEAIAETSRGKLSAQIDLATPAGCATLTELAADAHVFMQGYRPGGIGAKGFAPTDLARIRPGIVYVSLSAYGHVGPWAGRRGFDSLVQSATGFNLAEAEAFGQAAPRTLPMQVLDYASGYLMAFGATAALLRQLEEGGSWQVRVSLAGTAQWLRRLGRIANGGAVARPDPAARALAEASGFGQLMALPHPVAMSQTPPRWERPSMPPGSHPPRWP